MLSESKLQSIVWTSRIDQAVIFYANVLGLSIKEKSDGAVVFDVNGSDLRLSPIPSTTPTEHTVLGFSVLDVKQCLAWLADRGVVFETFEQFPHEPDGRLVTPDGSQVAWFRDPDGNLLSIVQFSINSH